MLKIPDLHEKIPYLCETRKTALDKNHFRPYSIIYMKNALNGKSSSFTSDREGRSPAESHPETESCEVHPGADTGKFSIRVRLIDVNDFEWVPYGT